MTSALQGHTECRTKVCVVCYKKGKRNISSELSFIQSHLIEGYTTDNLDFPCALCDHCHAVLNERINNDCAIFSTSQIASYDPGRPLLLRNALMSCDCKICKVAKNNIFPKKKQKRGRPKSLTEEAETPPAVVNICSKCFSPVGKGHPHNCSRRSRVDNIHRLLSGTPTMAYSIHGLIRCCISRPKLTGL